ncbi:DUF2513 domain-containing protein [Alloscardovia criceti]|uniref:DUF2513 domain-containing protein n=1 Tax=Alloscardovia criceti TaxID=356828 RepID=UPI000360D77E|nr:DUF2513 domain-containing protein [Alloscardovia criceti]
MRRDMDHVRHILRIVAQSSGAVDARVLVDSSHDFRMAVYHVDLLIQAGLVKGTIVRDMSGDILDAFIKSLTWKGNDFLDEVEKWG